MNAIFRNVRTKILETRLFGGSYWSLSFSHNSKISIPGHSFERSICLPFNSGNCYARLSSKNIYFYRFVFSDRVSKGVFE